MSTTEKSTDKTTTRDLWDALDDAQCKAQLNATALERFRAYLISAELIADADESDYSAVVLEAIAKNLRAIAETLDAAMCDVQTLKAAN